MDTKRTIRKILLVTMWVVIGGAMLTLLIAAIGRQKRGDCANVKIAIKAKDNQPFLSQQDVLAIINKQTNGKIKGRPRSEFNLHEIEEALGQNKWVKTAQLYFDNTDVLRVNVEESMPLARVFTTDGRSYYIDENGRKLDLSNQKTVKVPVFTGFPEKKISGGADSLLLDDVLSTAAFINSSPFWTSQIAQIDIDRSCGPDCREFNMVPVVGNHIVKLGTGAAIAEKFNRLLIFYKNVLSKTGFDKYRTIDVRFAGQIVAGKSENPKIDSVQLRKNVMEMLQQIKQMEQLNEADAATAQLSPGDFADRPTQVNPLQTAKSITKPKTASTESSVKDQKQPKAVMPAKANEEKSGSNKDNN